MDYVVGHLTCTRYMRNLQFLQNKTIFLGLWILYNFIWISLACDPLMHGGDRNIFQNALPIYYFNNVLNIDGLFLNVVKLFI